MSIYRSDFGIKISVYAIEPGGARSAKRLPRNEWIISFVKKKEYWVATSTLGIVKVVFVGEIKLLKVNSQAKQ